MNWRIEYPGNIIHIHFALSSDDKTGIHSLPFSSCFAKNVITSMTTV